MFVLAGCSGASEPDQAAVQPSAQPADPVDPAPEQSEPPEQSEQSEQPEQSEPPDQSEPPEQSENVSDAASDLPIGTVHLTTNGVEAVGSGVAFLRGEEVHARLLVGPVDEYLQFDLIGDPGNSPIALEPGQEQPTTVIGGDVASSDYRAIGERDDNTYTIVRGDDGSISGTLDFILLHWDGTRHEMTGVFRIAASESSDWDCDWDSDVVANCDFIDS